MDRLCAARERCSYRLLRERLLYGVYVLRGVTRDFLGGPPSSRLRGTGEAQRWLAQLVYMCIGHRFPLRAVWVSRNPINSYVREMELSQRPTDIVHCIPRYVYTYVTVIRLNVVYATTCCCRHMCGGVAQLLTARPYLHTGSVMDYDKHTCVAPPAKNIYIYFVDSLNKSPTESTSTSVFFLYDIP